MISLSRRTAWALLVAATSVFVAMSGCSRQGEGDRCDKGANGNADCEDGLVCREIDSCINLDRCCPPEGAPVGTDLCSVRNRVCTPDDSDAGEGSGGGATAGGTSNGGTAGTSGGTAGTSSGGMSGSDGGAGASTGGTDSEPTGGTDGEPTSGAGGEPTSGAGGA